MPRLWLPVTTGLGFFCVQLVYVIVKIVTPYFDMPDLVCGSLEG